MSSFCQIIFSLILVLFWQRSINNISYWNCSKTKRIIIILSTTQKYFGIIYLTVGFTVLLSWLDSWCCQLDRTGQNITYNLWQNRPKHNLYSVSLELASTNIEINTLIMVNLHKYGFQYQKRTIAAFRTLLYEQYETSFPKMWG